ncbi:MAG TPA: hypothetical protein VHF25_01660 [Nitriliruptorales bacterium]|nr:hypothetical protein [Nitriliruptorales bacterium]
MVTKRLARHNVVAVFATFEHAVAAVDALFGAGLEADELSLLGPDHAMRPGTGAVKEETTRATGGIGRGVAAGIPTGAVTGGGLGALIGLGVSAIPGVGLAAGAAALYAGVAGAVMGHIPGALLGAEAGARKAMMWTQTLEPALMLVEQGRVLVGVHSNDPERADLGEQQLRAHKAEQVLRLEADEDFEPPGDTAAILGTSVPSDHPEHPGGELGHKEADKRVGMTERGEPPTRGG